MRFMKLEICGQDYICGQASECPCPQDIKLLCDRRLGIGADGFFIIRRNEPENARIFAFNSSGELHADLITSSFCGILKLFIDSNVSHCIFSDDSDSVNVFISDFDGRHGMVSGDLGAVLFTARRQDIATGAPLIDAPVEVGNRILKMSCCYLAGVKAVHIAGDLGALKCEQLGGKITRHSLFQKRADAVFCEKTAPQTLYVRLFRNSGGEALCDIAGAAAAAACACRNGITEFSREIKITMPGGDIYVLCDRDYGVMATAQADFIFSGDTAAQVFC